MSLNAVTGSYKKKVVKYISKEPVRITLSHNINIKDPWIPNLVGKGGHTLLLRGGRRGFDPRQLKRTKRAFFPP